VICDLVTLYEFERRETPPDRSCVRVEAAVSNWVILGQISAISCRSGFLRKAARGGGEGGGLKRRIG